MASGVTSAMSGESASSNSSSSLPTRRRRVTPRLPLGLDPLPRPLLLGLRALEARLVDGLLRRVRVFLLLTERDARRELRFLLELPRLLGRPLLLFAFERPRLLLLLLFFDVCDDVPCRLDPLRFFRFGIVDRKRIDIQLAP